METRCAFYDVHVRFGVPRQTKYTERWNSRTLAKKIQSMLFERTALSRKPVKLIRQELDGLKSQDTLTPDLVFRDPYMLDFLGLKDTYARSGYFSFLESGTL